VTRHPRSLLVVVALVLGVATGCGSSGADTSTASSGSTPDTSTAPVAGITVAAAAGTKVTFSFGSSGQLKEQVLNGAPFDVFASANIDFVDEVIAAGKGDGSTKATYAFGRIVVFSPSKGPDAVTTLDGLRGPGVRNVAIANPEHAPYGVAAEQALRAAGLLDTVSPKLVLGENVSDTLRLATTGNADAAIVALSLVKTSDDGTWALIDEHLHEPLEQALVVTGVDPSRTDAARAFAAYINSPAGREVMNRYGFVLPDETPG
jgi:molybdate transport system substrate-binding protein